LIDNFGIFQNNANFEPCFTDSFLLISKGSNKPDRLVQPRFGSKKIDKFAD